MTDYGDFTDAELVGLLKSGNRTAFAEIYQRYKYVLHHHAWNKTLNEEDAKDTIQEVFTTLWTKREHIEVGSNLSGYLYTCVRNHILNMMARKQVKTKYIDSIQQFSTLQDSVVTDHRVRENQLRSAIEKEISALPPRMREVFELSRKQNLSHKQIAELMGTTEQTVKKQMTYALKTLRKKLGLPLFLMMLLFY